jgi:hypothetical protein
VDRPKDKQELQEWLHTHVAAAGVLDASSVRLVCDVEPWAAQPGRVISVSDEQAAVLAAHGVELQAAMDAYARSEWWYSTLSVTLLLRAGGVWLTLSTQRRESVIEGQLNGWFVNCWEDCLPLWCELGQRVVGTARILLEDLRTVQLDWTGPRELPSPAPAWPT